MKFFLTMFFASAARILAQTPADQSVAVLQAERDGCAAYLRGKADKIANFLTDDYTLTNSKGKISTAAEDRKSTRLNSSHQIISYAVFCLKKKKKNKIKI